jgi:hypothetical protein
MKTTNLPMTGRIRSRFVLEEDELTAGILCSSVCISSPSGAPKTGYAGGLSPKQTDDQQKPAIKRGSAFS